MSSERWSDGIRVHRRRRRWHPTPVLLPGKSHGWRSLVGESDRTEQLHFHFSLSRIGEGNGNPLQCSCLENPRDGGAWWAVVYGVAQSQTQLKRLSSSSSWYKTFNHYNLYISSTLRKIMSKGKKKYFASSNYPGIIIIFLIHKCIWMHIYIHNASFAKNTLFHFLALNDSYNGKI